MSQQTDNVIAEGAMHAELSLAAYASFSPDMEIADIIAALKKEDMTQSQAEAFAATWRVVDQFNSLTGASATVFENIDTGQRHLAIRGTEPADIRDWFADLLIAVGVPPSFNPQYVAIKGKVADWIADGTLTRFDSAGHSSGAYFTAALRKDYPENVIHAYGYLTPGPGGLLGDAFEFFGASLTPDPETTIFTTQGGHFSPITDVGLEWGAWTKVCIPTGNNLSHSMVNMLNGMIDLGVFRGQGISGTVYQTIPHLFRFGAPTRRPALRPTG